MSVPSAPNESLNSGQQAPLNDNDNTPSPITPQPAVQAKRTKPILQEWAGFPPLPSVSDFVNLNLTLGPQETSTLPLENIQGDIFVGMKKLNELFFFYEINNVDDYKCALRSKEVISLITSTAILIGPAEFQPLAFLNMGFSQRGLVKLGVTDDLGDEFFTKGQKADAPELKDNLDDWEAPWSTSEGIHGVFLIGSDEQRHVDDLLKTLLNAFGSSVSEITRIQGVSRPGPQAGHEHFGFLDGISNPAVSGFATHTQPGQVLIPPGRILTGRDDDTKERPKWALDGSFLVFRKLQQLVPEWNKYVVANALQNPEGTLTFPQGAALFGARLVGRWQSGAPLDLAPLFDDPKLGADFTRNNNFNFAHPDSLIDTDQTRCPFSAHVRKARPRADLPPFGAAIGQDSNTANQAIRAGIPYGPEVHSDEHASGVTNTDRGLAFVEYQSSIENGFRFQQTRWLNNPTFPPFKKDKIGLDPVMGQTTAPDGIRSTFGLNPFDETQEYHVPTFVKAKGGEYFFSPSISAIQDTIASVIGVGNF